MFFLLFFQEFFEWNKQTKKFRSSYWFSIVPISLCPVFILLLLAAVCCCFGLYIVVIIFYLLNLNLNFLSNPFYVIIYCQQYQIYLFLNDVNWFCFETIFCFCFVKHHPFRLLLAEIVFSVVECISLYFLLLFSKNFHHF